MTLIPYPTYKSLEERCRHARDKFMVMNHFDPRVVEIFYNNAYFAGGCISSLILEEEPKDWDIFLSTEKTRDEAVAWFQKYPKNVVCTTKNAITLKNNFQIITCEFAPPEVMVNEIFDFVHTGGYFSFRTSSVSIDSYAYEACKHKRLIPTLPVEKLSAERVQRFIKRGWTLDTGELAGLKLLTETDLGNGESWGS